MLTIHDYRALILLRVVVQWMAAGETAGRERISPVGNREANRLVLRQSDLLEILPEEWSRIGLDVQFPFGITTPQQIHRAVTLLRDAGLVVPGGHGIPYRPTESGIALATVLTDDWRAWPPIEEMA